MGSSSIKKGGVEVEHNMSTYTVYEVEWLNEKERKSRQKVKLDRNLYL